MGSEFFWNWIERVREKRDEWFGAPGKPPDLQHIRAKESARLREKRLDERPVGLPTPKARD